MSTSSKGKAPLADCWERCWCKFAEGDGVQPVPELLLEENNYFEALVCNTLSWHTSNEIQAKEQCKPHTNSTLAQAGTVLEVSILDLKLQRLQEAKGLSGNKILLSLSIVRQLWPKKVRTVSASTGEEENYPNTNNISSVVPLSGSRWCPHPVLLWPSCSILPGRDIWQLFSSEVLQFPLWCGKARGPQYIYIINMRGKYEQQQKKRREKIKESSKNRSCSGSAEGQIAKRCSPEPQDGFASLRWGILEVRRALIAPCATSSHLLEHLFYQFLMFASPARQGHSVFT